MRPVPINVAFDDTGSGFVFMTLATKIRQGGYGISLIGVQCWYE